MAILYPTKKELEILKKIRVFTWAGDNLFRDVNTGKRILRSLYSKGLINKCVLQEPGYLPTYELTKEALIYIS